MLINGDLASGKLSHNDGKSPFVMCKSTISRVLGNPTAQLIKTPRLRRLFLELSWGRNTSVFGEERDLGILGNPQQLYDFPTSFMHEHEIEHVIIKTYSGWWFGCHEFYFPINIGLLSSSQLTNSIIFQRGGQKPPTSINN